MSQVSYVLKALNNGSYVANLTGGYNPGWMDRERGVVE